MSAMCDEFNNVIANEGLPTSDVNCPQFARQIVHVLGHDGIMPVAAPDVTHRTVCVASVRYSNNRVARFVHIYLYRQHLLAEWVLTLRSGRERPDDSHPPFKH